MAVIRSGTFQGFDATDEELLQAAAQILDVPQAQLELSRKGKVAVVQGIKGEQNARYTERN